MDTLLRKAALRATGPWQGRITCTAARLTAEEAALAPLDLALLERRKGPRQPCGGDVDPETMQCLVCGTLAMWSRHDGVCDLCGQRRSVLRQGQMGLSTCSCHVPPEVLAARAREEAVRQAKADQEAQWERARRMQEAEMQMQRDQAADCLASRDGDCHEPHPDTGRAPYACCRYCRLHTGRAR